MVFLYVDTFCDMKVGRHYLPVYIQAGREFLRAQKGSRYQCSEHHHLYIPATLTTRPA